MKIIDLLNKIANGEEVPEKIKVNGIIFEYQGDDYLYIDKHNDNHEYWLFSDGYTDGFQWLDNFLKTEIEILEEEKKIPEKIKIDNEIKEILDYITNLQEENKRLNNKIHALKSKGE